MKQPRKPVLTEKKQITAAGLDWKNWSVQGRNNNSITLINKKSGKRRVIRD